MHPLSAAVSSRSRQPLRGMVLMLHALLLLLLTASALGAAGSARQTAGTTQYSHSSMSRRLLAAPAPAPPEASRPAVCAEPRTLPPSPDWRWDWRNLVALALSAVNSLTAGATGQGGTALLIPIFTAPFLLNLCASGAAQHRRAHAPYEPLHTTAAAACMHAAGVLDRCAGVLNALTAAHTAAAAAAATAAVGVIAVPVVTMADVA